MAGLTIYFTGTNFKKIFHNFTNSACFGLTLFICILGKRRKQEIKHDAQLKQCPSELWSEKKFSTHGNEDPTESKILLDENEDVVKPDNWSSEVTVQSDKSDDENLPSSSDPPEMQQSSTTKSLVDLAKTASSKLRLTNQADVDKYNRLLDLSTDLNISYYKDDKGRIIAEFLDPEDPTLFIETEIVPPEDSEGFEISTHFESSSDTNQGTFLNQTNEMSRSSSTKAPALPKRHILPPRATNQVTLITFPKSSVKREIESLQRHLAMTKSNHSQAFPLKNMEDKQCSFLPDTTEQAKSSSGSIQQSEKVQSNSESQNNVSVTLENGNIVPDESTVTSVPTSIGNEETVSERVLTSVPSSDNTSLQILSQGNQVAQSVVNDILRMNNVNVSPGSVVYVMSGDKVYQVQTPDPDSDLQSTDN